MAVDLLAPQDLATDEAPYPAPPWRLRGEAVIVPVPVRTAAARAFVPDGLELVSAAGRTAGGVLLARYGEGATLGYDELIIFAGAVRAGGRRGMWVSHIYVDLPASVAGGRRIWGLPKELAEFGWRPRAVSVHGLLEARISRAPVKAPVPLRPSTFGRRDGRFVWTGTKGTLRAAPSLVRLSVPGDSPFKALGLDGTWPAVAGDRLDLPFPAAIPV